MSLFARFVPIFPASLNGTCPGAPVNVHPRRAILSAPKSETRSGTMHIIAIAMALLGGVAVWDWRFKALGDAGRDAIDLVGRARGAFRMRRFRKASEASILTTVDDPALAAAILLFAIAGERPAGSEPAPQVVRFELGDIVAPDKLDETIAYAEWAARAVADPRDCVRRFTALWRDKLTADERGELLEMAAHVTGPAPATHQQVVLGALRTALIADGTR
jgi:hypothetical protein